MAAVDTSHTTRNKILTYIQQADHSPTIREIANHVERSHSTVHVHLAWLERKGLIRRFGEQRRIYPVRGET